MSLKKTSLFTKSQKETAAMAKAIAHPDRIAILQHLANVDACLCVDLAEELGLAPSTISQHLRELKAAGLIQATVQEGTSLCYSINPKVWNHYYQVFTTFFKDDVAGTGS